MMDLKFILIFLLLHCAQGRLRGQDRFGRRSNVARDRTRHRTARSGKPNIIVILTDDQDSELGSMQFMPKTLKILRDGGAHFTNSFVTTPMCCPSRSSFLTGMYVHNHNVYTNNDNCSSASWQQNYENRNFATYLKSVGYSNGYFGKYLNEYNGDHVPVGWHQWLGLVRNSRFYNYTVNFNGELVKHRDNYYRDYFTDLIANDSVRFLKLSKRQNPEKPIMMVLSMPAPHGPEDSAPQYQHMFKNVTTHRTPSWNFAPNPDKQWLLQVTPKMEPIRQAFTDLLHRKRLQTLQSVDDAVEKVYAELRNLGELDNTYIVYTSDHGYHLGQYGLIKGKAMPYEMDVRVPFYIRGPGIRRGVRIPHIVLNIDVAPTILEMAGVVAPAHMDGKSIFNILGQTGDPNNFVDRVLLKKKPWRGAFLLQRGKVTGRMVVRREQMEAEKNNMSHTLTECSKEQYQPPCKPGQNWVCVKNEYTGRLRFQKCRKHNTNKQQCVCPKSTRTQVQQVSTKRDVVSRCRVRQDNTVACDETVIRNKNLLKTQRDAIDKMINEYRQDIKKLKKIRKHLKNGQIVVENLRNGQCECSPAKAKPRVKRSKKKMNKKYGLMPRPRKDPGCALPGVECISMTNEHWKTEPKWRLGPFCACNNAGNNSYWCVRNLNETHNFLYCEFVTGFISYYDLTRDPYQLRNAVHDVDYSLLRQLHDLLNILRSCKGSRECTIKFKTKDKSHEGPMVGPGPVDGARLEGSPWTS